MKSNVERVRCRGHNKDGSQCKASPLRGATVCRMHGGAAPQVRKKAAERLEQAADRMAQQLLAIAEDKGLPAPVRLAAIRDALDRAGLHRGSDLVVEVKPWERVAQAIFGMGEFDGDVEIVVGDEEPPLRAASQRADQVMDSGGDDPSDVGDPYVLPPSWARR